MKTHSTDELRLDPKTGTVGMPENGMAFQTLLRPGVVEMWRLVDLAPKLFECMEEFYRLTAEAPDEEVQELRAQAKRLIDQARGANHPVVLCKREV